MACAAAFTVKATRQRAALQNAQKLKQNAEEIVDSIVADEAGKMPDDPLVDMMDLRELQTHTTPYVMAHLLRKPPSVDTIFASLRLCAANTAASP